jgi:hypothetical protein
MIDTKAHWKRRALRAEAELHIVRKCQETSRAFDAANHRIQARNAVALREIREAIHSLDFESEPTP